MKKLKIIIIGILAIVALKANAQIPVRAFEFEASIGRSFPLSHYRGEKK